MRRSASRDTKRSVRARDVDAYVAALPKEPRVTLDKFRKIIKTAASKAEETISYQIPTFKYHGPLVFFAAFKNHCSLYVLSKSIRKNSATNSSPMILLGQQSISRPRIHYQRRSSRKSSKQESKRTSHVSNTRKTVDIIPFTLPQSDQSRCL
jgi:hypothetical protein